MDSVFKREFDSKSLWHLKSLTLAGLGIDSLGAWLCSSLGQLTHLDVSSNKFKQIPAAVAELTALQELSLSHNQYMKLGPQDIGLVCALSTLTMLDLSKGSYSDHEMEIMWALSRRMPGLDCIFATWFRRSLSGVS